MGWGVRDYPAPPEPEPMPKCPVCGAECVTVYRAHDFAVVGCDMCIDAVDAYEWLEERQ